MTPSTMVFMASVASVSTAANRACLDGKCL